MMVYTVCGLLDGVKRKQILLALFRDRIRVKTRVNSGKLKQTKLVERLLNFNCE